MNRYLITITPDLGDNASGRDRPQTRMRVEIDGNRAVVRELTIQVSGDAELAADDLLTVDLELLARAFASRAGVERTSQSSIPQDEDTAPAPTAATGARKVSRRRSGTGGRAYRRMPDPAQLKSVYKETRSIAGVAARYGVPNYTAQGWIGRLRRRGVIPVSG